MFSQSIPLSGRVTPLRERFPENSKYPLEKQRYGRPSPAITTSSDLRLPPIQRPTHFVNARFCTRPRWTCRSARRLKRPRPLSTQFHLAVRLGAAGRPTSRHPEPPHGACRRTTRWHRAPRAARRPEIERALPSHPAHRRISSGPTSAIGSSIEHNNTSRKPAKSAEPTAVHHQFGGRQCPR